MNFLSTSERCGIGSMAVYCQNVERKIHGGWIFLLTSMDYPLAITNDGFNMYRNLASGLLGRLNMVRISCVRICSPDRLKNQSSSVATGGIVGGHKLTATTRQRDRSHPVIAVTSSYLETGRLLVNLAMITPPPLCHFLGANSCHSTTSFCVSPGRWW
jgi:hypothetical protein